MDNSTLNACMVGFILENTLSDHGRVSRGICKVSEQQELTEITERTHIYKKDTGGAYFEENNQKTDLSGKEIVSMNLLGFTSKVFELMDEMFVDFLKESGHELKSEFFIPMVLDKIRDLGIKVPVLTSAEQWFGVTYPEDKDIAVSRINELIEKGVYPNQLWR
jgi:hypothetical protein